MREFADIPRLSVYGVAGSYFLRRTRTKSHLELEPVIEIRLNRLPKRRGCRRCQQPLGFGSPGRTRTCDQPVNSRLLYQLSYRGTKGTNDKIRHSSKK